MAFDLVYDCKSTDTGAPTVSGTVAEFDALLYALLVTGFGTKTGGTLTRSGSVATWNITAHGFRDGVIVDSSGWDQSEYNGLFKITRIDADNFSFTVSGSPATPGTSAGTPSVKVAGAGWTREFTGTRKSVYLQPAGATGIRVRVDDTNAQNAQWRIYETMSDVDTGTNLCPTNAQIAVGSGPYFYKSTAASSTTRAWKFWSDGRSFILIVNTDGSNLWTPMLVGDFASENSGDAYPVFMAAQSSSSATGGNVLGAHIITNTNVTQAGTYLLRNSAGTVGPLLSGKNCSQWAAPGGSNGIFGGAISGNGITYPAPIGGGILFEPVLINEGGTIASGPRGRIRGLFAPWHHGLTNGDTFQGAAGTPYAGKTFEIATFGPNGRAIIQTSDWSV